MNGEYGRLPLINEPMGGGDTVAQIDNGGPLVKVARWDGRGVYVKTSDGFILFPWSAVAFAAHKFRPGAILDDYVGEF